jgi:hypothetical protein
MDSAYYRVRCLRGAQTGTIYVFACWARDVAHAFDLARSNGYTPISLD